MMPATQKFSNSKLVSYTKYSPNNSGQRTMNIDMLAIHTMAGNLSVETCGSLFADKNRSASSNYGIGSDGRIALYVDEKNRAWTTSSSAIDNRAVTIEVASKSNKEPFDITDAAWDALIDLSTDICRRNNIKELKWLADKDKLCQVDVQNMAAHRWVKPKSCPGTFLYNNMGTIAKKVNENLKADKITERESTLAALSEKNEEKIWKFLTGKFGNEYAAAGIMGNLYALSSLIPNNLKNSDEKRLEMDDTEYTKKVNSGEYTGFTIDGAGYGLAMWSKKGKKRKLLELANVSGKGIGNLNVQLSFLYDDIASDAELLKKFKNCDTVKKATRLFITEYTLHPIDDKRLEKRLEYSKDIYKRNKK